MCNLKKNTPGHQLKKKPHSVITKLWFYEYQAQKQCHPIKKKGDHQQIQFGDISFKVLLSLKKILASPQGFSRVRGSVLSNDTSGKEAVLVGKEEKTP
ncbi:hypothetical protein CEXT_748581 [Caerostris extrusa]|uniref:Uncharacterized protein n=1 Tax=Caerostris extrusa TaxID=172846 RepID=A0AAV4Y4V2_CAEEX|nr:hypothetical protein CEXT_748581 [Caerostris extrusa]